MQTTEIEPATIEHPVDHTVPTDRWTFDADVTRVFENMLERSIPQYELMRQACFDLASAYVQPKTAIVDLGCSRGEAIEKLLHRFGAANRFVGCELSEPMVTATRERFAGYITCGIVDIRQMDLRTAYPPDLASVTLSILTLQFIPIEYRQQIVDAVYAHLVPGGAFLLVEKILGNGGDLDSLFVRTYYALKAANGYSQEEIERKRLSLEGVLVPVTARWNEEMLHSAGFRRVDCFWRWMNFAGWIAVK